MPQDRARRPRGDGRARPRELPQDLGRDRAAHPRRRSGRSSGSPRCAASRRRSRRRSSGASTTRTSRRRRGRWPTAAASSSTTARTPATGRSPRPTRSGRRRTPAPRRRSTGTRWPSVDPAAFTIQTMRDRVDEGRRPHRRDVEAQGEPDPALREARPRAAGYRLSRSATVGSPFFGFCSTWATVHWSGSLSSRKRSSFVPWRKRCFCHLS